MQRDEAEDRRADGGDAERDPGDKSEEDPADGGEEGAADGDEEGPADLELVERLRDGDGEALRLLMGRYDRLVRYAVFRLCRAECLRDPTFLDARASETWTGLVQSAQQGRLKFLKNLKTYLIQIARNKCADAKRRSNEAAGDKWHGMEEDLRRLQAPVPPSVELLIQAEEVLALRECIENLTLSDKRICEQMEDLVAGRWTLAGEALGMPESTLRSRWAVIVGKLKACLEKKIPKKFAPPD
jgi:DNA-directed RNA polymerase specialized sigma24 family protein